MPKKLFEKGNPGRKVGSVNKNSKLIKEVFAEAFNALQESEEHNIQTWAKENKSDFYKLAIRIIPTQININSNIAIVDEKIIFE